MGCQSVEAQDKGHVRVYSIWDILFTVGLIIQDLKKIEVFKRSWGRKTMKLQLYEEGTVLDFRRKNSDEDKFESHRRRSCE